MTKLPKSGPLARLLAAVPPAAPPASTTSAPRTRPSVTKSFREAPPSLRVQRGT